MLTIVNNKNGGHVISIQLCKTTSDCESNTPEFDYVPLTPNTSAVNIEFETDVNNDIFTELKEVRKRHPNQFSCAYLNINSLAINFVPLKNC
jgi:hypothetical protein